MIEIDRIEAQADKFRDEFVNASPFEYVVIDNFCDSEKLNALLDQIPNPDDGGINRSRDYVFARNKFEKSNFREIGPLFSEIYDDFMSDRFRSFLAKVTGADVWVDPEFHGGGIHQGGAASFLDMHADFSHHPLQADWERELNILLYLNRDWEPSYGGQLQIKNKITGEQGAVEPLFNRCLIMRTKAHTLHGYNPVSFPEGQYRRSIATYAYSAANAGAVPRSTTWFPEQGGALKRLLGRTWPLLVSVKTRIFGSATARNR